MSRMILRYCSGFHSLLLGSRHVEKLYRPLCQAVMNESKELRQTLAGTVEAADRKDLAERWQKLLLATNRLASAEVRSTGYDPDWRRTEAEWSDLKEQMVTVRKQLLSLINDCEFLGEDDAWSSLDSEVETELRKAGLDLPVGQEVSYFTPKGAGDLVRLVVSIDENFLLSLPPEDITFMYSGFQQHPNALNLLTEKRLLKSTNLF